MDKLNNYKKYIKTKSVGDARTLLGKQNTYISNLIWAPMKNIYTVYFLHLFFNILLYVKICLIWLDIKQFSKKSIKNDQKIISFCSQKIQFESFHT